jgi:hypothetical protein
MHRSVRVRSERNANIIGNDGVHPPRLFRRSWTPYGFCRVRVEIRPGVVRWTLEHEEEEGQDRSGAVPVVYRRKRCEERRDAAERTRAAVSSRPSVEHQARASRAGRTGGRGDLLLGPMEHQAQDQESRGGMDPASGGPDRDAGGARAGDEAAQVPLPRIRCFSPGDRLHQPVSGAVSGDCSPPSARTCLSFADANPISGWI